MTPTRTVVVAKAWHKKKMDEETYQKKLEELGVTEEEFYSVTNGNSVRFKHPLMGIIEAVSYSKRAVEDLKKTHGIDAASETRDMIIRLLEERFDIVAARLVYDGDVDGFFERFDFAFLEMLANKFPGVAKAVANPEWKSR
jgi:hypothetical protein